MEDLKSNHMEGQLSERAITRTITRTIRRIFDEDALSVEPKMALWDDEVTEKRIFSKVWKVVKKALDENVSPSSDMGANDEKHGDISERIPIWMTTGKVATSDEKARENLGITARIVMQVLRIT